MAGLGLLVFEVGEGGFALVSDFRGLEPARREGNGRAGGGSERNGEGNDASVVAMVALLVKSRGLGLSFSTQSKRSGLTAPKSAPPVQFSS